MGGAVRTGPVMRRVWKDGRPKSLGFVGPYLHLFFRWPLSKQACLFTHNEMDGGTHVSRHITETGKEAKEECSRNEWQRQGEMSTWHRKKTM